MSRPEATSGPCVVDTMVVAMFVDADQVPLLAALAGGSLFVPPSIIDPQENPPFTQQPLAEFAKGAFYFQQRLGQPLDAVRLNRRIAFYLSVNRHWQPLSLSSAELQMAAALADPTTWTRAEEADPTVRIKKVSRGEAECAAVAVTRGWTLWSDDAAIIDLLAVLHPGHPVERISDLVVRAVRQGLIDCEDAVHLHNNVFKGTLGLWTTRTLGCKADQIVVS